MSEVVDFFSTQWTYIVYASIAIILLIAAVWYGKALGNYVVIPVGFSAAFLVFIIYAIFWWHWPLDWFSSRVEWVLWLLFHRIVEAIPG